MTLTKADGPTWGKSEQARRIKEACGVAQIRPAASLHALRHSYASMLVEAGTPLAFAADALGHTATRMVEEHYAHLAPNYIHDAVRANLPQFGVSPSVKVQKLPMKGFRTPMERQPRPSSALRLST